MVLFNYALKELTAKIVYYGPGLSGKTTNLQYIYDELPIKNKGRMLTLATETDRTLYFDFLPVDAGVVRGIKTRVQLYTVPGQVFYNATRRMVLKGADGIVFVADSQRNTMEANLESMDNLRENLRAHDLNLEQMPLVLQFNKRDLDEINTVEEMNDKLNQTNCPFYEAVASEGIGVEDTLQAISGLVLKTVLERYGGDKKLAPLGAPVSDPSTTDPDPATTDPKSFFATGGSGGLFGNEGGLTDGPADREARASATTWPSVAESSDTPANTPREALDEMNIEGLLDDVLSQEEELAVSDKKAQSARPETAPTSSSAKEPDAPPADIAVPRPHATEDAFAGLLDEAAGAREVESILEERARSDSSSGRSETSDAAAGSKANPPDEEVEVEIEFLSDRPDSEKDESSGGLAPAGSPAPAAPESAPTSTPTPAREPEPEPAQTPDETDELDPRTSSLSRLMQTRVSISRSELAAVSAPREQNQPTSLASESGSASASGARNPKPHPEVDGPPFAEAGGASSVSTAGVPTGQSAEPPMESVEPTSGTSEDGFLIVDSASSPGVASYDATPDAKPASSENSGGIVGRRAKLVEVPVRISLSPDEDVEEIELLLKIRIDRESPSD